MSEQELHTIPTSSSHEEYEKVNNVQGLGKGNQGNVKLVRRKRDGKLLARKKIRSSSPLQHEREIIQKLKHPHIIRFYGCEFHEQRRCLFLYMEYCPLEDLDKFFTQNPDAVNDHSLWQILAQLAAALAYCHHGIGLKDGYFLAEETFVAVIHRDIKPSNILVSSRENGKIVVKLCDFGISKEYLTTNEGSSVGTLKYREPEFIKGWAPKSDIYSIGHTMRTLAELNKNFIPSEDLEKVISKCEEKDRSRRICTIRLLDSVPKEFRDSLGRLSSQIEASTSSRTEPDLNCFAGGVIAMVINIDPMEPRRIKRLRDDLGDDQWAESCTSALGFALRHNEYHSKAVPRILEEPNIIAGITKKKKLHLLLLAAEFGNVTMVQKMMVHGVNVNGKGANRETPLHLAASGGHMEVIEKLLERGAKIDAAKKDGQTALHFAAYSGHLKVAEKLLGQGATVDAKDNAGQTPLHLAASRGNQEFIEKLLGWGARADARNDAGRTPLHLATLGGHLEFIKKILEKGATADAKDNDGKTPLHFVDSRGDQKAIKKVLQRGVRWTVDTPDPGKRQRSVDVRNGLRWVYCCFQ